MGNSSMASEVMKSNKVSLNLEGLSSSMQQIASGYNSKYNNVKESIKVISLASLQFFCKICHFEKKTDAVTNVTKSKNRMF